MKDQVQVSSHIFDAFRVDVKKKKDPERVLTLMGEMWKCSKKLSPDVSLSDASISSACSSCRSFSISCD